MKIICPFCHAELDSKDDEPTTVTQPFGNVYTCHKVICKNKEKHPDKDNIAVVFKEEKK